MQATQVPMSLQSAMALVHPWPRKSGQAPTSQPMSASGSSASTPTSATLQTLFLPPQAPAILSASF